jgi:hypothetical protein
MRETQRLEYERRLAELTEKLEANDARLEAIQAKLEGLAKLFPKEDVHRVTRDPCPVPPFPECLERLGLEDPDGIG